jgi:cation transport protein ChaC
MASAVFAYGSLVNRLARPAGLRSAPAVLPHWARHWRHCIQTPHGRICALTVAPDPDTSIRGVVLFCEADTVEELDQREIDYHQVRVSVRLDAPEAGMEEVGCVVHVGDLAYDRAGSYEFPIWRSYLDCVLAGYIELGGRCAAEDFIASTRGWNVPILDDRGDPKYPRAVALRSHELREIDEILALHGLLSNVVR